MPRSRRKKSVSLGKLERAAMNVVWERDGPVNVPEVHAALSAVRPLAYTTAMTVMNRLYEKGLLHRSEERRPYTYWAAVSREDYSAGVMLDALAELADREAVLSRFVARIGRRDAELLRDLVERSREREP